MNRLRRAESAPPIRIVHLGLGAFHRSHQVWYTSQASDAGDWGIAAFTGRSPRAAAHLAEQDGLYTLIERDSTGDRATIIRNLAAAHDGADLPTLRSLISQPEVVVVTMTVTEAGYDFGDDRQRLAGQHAPVTPLGRLFSALQARRDSDAGPIAVVSCDNLPDNGEKVALGLHSIARGVDPAMSSWLSECASFVSTTVDRITPRSTEVDAEVAASLTGFADHAPVVAEPFSEWILAGLFPAGRPDWESAGASVVASIAPYAQRKLWLLNGAHTLLAARGLRRGLRTVAEAVDDPVVAVELQRFWDAAVQHLPAEMDGPSYVRRLRQRFQNGRIEHLLSQINQDALTKFDLRIAPVAEAERARGRTLDIATRVEHDIRLMTN